jgi:hypothetical protein
MQRHLSRWLAVTGAVVIATLAAGPSQAAVDRCQKELMVKADIFRTQVKKAFQLCLDTIRREDAKNAKKPGTGFLVTAAHVCQTQLARVFDNVSKPGKSQRDRFYAAVDKAFTAGATPRCDAGDLTTLGHLRSGPANEAPGAATQDFVKRWLAVQAVRGAYTDTVGQARDAINNLNRAIAAPSRAAGNKVPLAGTNCDLPPTCDYRSDLGCRPDLCQMTKIQCRTHACRLKNTSQANTYLGALGGGPSPLGLSGSSNFEICQMNGFGYGLGDSGEGVLILGTPTRAINPVSLLGQTVCVDTIAAAGFCAASGDFLGKAKNYSFCQDRVAGPAPDVDSCPGAPTSTPSAPVCFCHVSGIPTSNRCGASFPPCAAGSCGMTADGNPCFPGTQVGPVKVVTGGTTGAGDCVVLSSTSFTTVAPGNVGPDTEPCTNDDTAPRAAIATTPFTTGVAEASLLDAVLFAPGSCANHSNHACVTDADCTTSSGADTCVGVATDDIVAGPLTGGALVSAAQPQTSNLSNLKLVGAFPAAAGALGDLATDFTIECQ